MIEAKNLLIIAQMHNLVGPRATAYYF